jgi:hypothetical protein
MGKTLELPVATSKPALMIFAFTRTAGKDARLWNEHLSKDLADPLLSYQVVVLESVPKLFRGTAVSGIRNGMLPAMQDRTILLYQDEKLWRQRLAASDNDRAYVFLLGPDGRILWNNSKAFTDAEYARMKVEFQRIPQPHV